MASVFLDQEVGLELKDLLDLPALKELARHIQNVHQLGILLISSKNEIMVESCSDFSVFNKFLSHPKAKKVWEKFPKKISNPLPKMGESMDHEISRGIFFRVLPIILELNEIGGVAFGPFLFKDEDKQECTNKLEKIGLSKKTSEEFINKIPSFSKQEFNAIGRFLNVMFEVLVFSSYKRHLTNMAHVESITESYKQLEKANKELQNSYEKLKEIDQMKSNFLAVVSHELRTPLTSVIGYSEMLLEGVTGKLNEGQQKYINVIMEKGEHLLHLIGEVLNVSKIEAGQMKLKLVETDIREIIKSSIETIRPLADKKELQLSHKISEDIPDKMKLDRDKLIHIYSNLLSNAVKFNNKGGSISLSLETSFIKDSLPSQNKGEEFAKQSDKKYLLSTIKDTGVGISKDQLNKIFEKFYQVDSSSTRVYGGTGLGLTIVKSFVEIHGGNIWADSQLNKWTCFYFTIPFNS